MSRLIFLVWLVKKKKSPMKKNLLAVLRCPNARATRWEAYGQVVRRAGSRVSSLQHGEILPEDDIETGFIADRNSGQIHLIVDFVLVMLADADVDPAAEIPLLKQALETCPAEYAAIIQARIARLQDIGSTEVGDWNRGEMRYYDQEVATPEKRAAFLETMRRQPVWHIFLERKTHVLDRIGVVPVQRVLEIGCGNARTVAWLYAPGAHAYAYVGTDISLQRLILAKQAVPEGDFVQCSALNLPFANGVFDVCLAFGVLHHLPDPAGGLREGFGKLRPGGEMGIHEPLEKVQHLIPEQGFLRRVVDRVFLTYVHSEHDNELNLEQASQMVAQLHGVVVYQHYSGSLLRTVGARVLHALGPLERVRAAWQLLIGMDGAFLRVFCRRPNSLGPNAVFWMVRKPQ